MRGTNVKRQPIGIASAFLAAIINSSNYAIFAKDLNSIVTICNINAEKIFGYPAEEMIVDSITGLIPSDRLTSSKEQSDLLLNHPPEFEK